MCHHIHFSTCMVIFHNPQPHFISSKNYINSSIILYINPSNHFAITSHYFLNIKLVDH
ncbi:hypothetical protein HanXRQr2_Chr10g0449671 [Helianthus annuus]|uniref:Uncharacterized protein n=1 Tax=Helianthus annuus TaxID=4232 RepID=A0A9K3HY92_HELAN|nr:hypothetical protein HanXRQr2_Chr10g0449671 [Helianthus annuus]